MNNAVSRTAQLLAVAVLGAVLLGGFNRHLDTTVAQGLPAMERRRLAAAHTSTAAEQQAVKEAFVAGYREVLWISVALALASSAVAAIFIANPAARYDRS